MVAHVHADHEKEDGVSLLATLYTGTGGRVHEELKEPHCWLHRWANRSRPSVRLTSLPTKLEDTALPTGCIFLYLFLTDKVTATELQSACPHTTTLSLCQLYEKTSPEGIQLPHPIRLPVVPSARRVGVCSVRVHPSRLHPRPN